MISPTSSSMQAAQLAQATKAHLAELQQQIELDPLARALTSVGAWRTFMRLHVFAVWDFMSLLKRLQSEVTCQRLPWRPAKGGEGARLIGEIALAEESDVDGLGGHCSHFELYRRAMQQAGADTGPIDGVLVAIEGGAPFAEALAAAQVPQAVRLFVLHTLETATTGSVQEVAASFLFGREAVLPALFHELLAALQAAEPQLSVLAYYFARHIEVDGDEHGPKALALLTHLCGTDATAWAHARAAAERSLQLRAQLWRAIDDEVRLSVA